MIFLVPNLFMHFIPCTHLHNDIHIDHGIEEQTQEQPLIEEPEDQERTRSPKSTRRPHLTSHPRKLTLARKVGRTIFSQLILFYDYAYALGVDWNPIALDPWPPWP